MRGEAVSTHDDKFFCILAAGVCPPLKERAARVTELEAALRNVLDSDTCNACLIEGCGEGARCECSCHEDDASVRLTARRLLAKGTRDAH